MAVFRHVFRRNEFPPVRRLLVQNRMAKGPRRTKVGQSGHDWGIDFAESGVEGPVRDPQFSLGTNALQIYGLEPQQHRVLLHHPGLACFKSD